MIKQIKLLAFICLTGNLLFAQRNFTIQEATLGLGNTFATERIIQPNWRNSSTLTFASAKRDSLLERSFNNDWNSQLVLTAKDLNNLLNEQITETTFRVTTLPADLKWKNNNTITFSIPDVERKNIYLIEMTTDNKKAEVLHKIPFASNNHLLSRNGEYIAWLNGNNIEVADKKGRIAAVTTETDKAIVNGSPDTHRNEFGVDQGMWWSPKQDQLLYYRNDQTGVSDYPIPLWQTRVAENKNIKYPMAGMTNEKVTLHIYDIYTQQKTTLNTGDKDQFLTMVTWDPSGNYVYVGLLNREQNHLKLNKYNAATGVLEGIVFEEKSSTYTEPSQGLVFVPNNSKSFIYISEKDGYRQPYLYTEDKLVRNLGFENVIAAELLGFDKDSKHLYYKGVTNQGLDRQLFKVNLKNGKTEQITAESGTHNLVFNEDKTYFLDQFSNITTPNKVSIVNTTNKKSVEILNAKNPYEGKVTMPEMELITLKAADGKTLLNGRIFYPTNFDGNKKYPVMVYVYGGPHAQLISNSWLGGANLFFHYMAQNGYIVFTIDNRGSANRGRDFEHVIHRKLGQIEMADQMEGIKYLGSLPFVNKDKIGIYGWSFGGFMTTTLSVTYPEIFKVGVAGGPVMDWKLYEIMYGERYMDTPEENPEGYKLTSLLNKADKLNNKLLIIHGAQDPVVLQQHSMLFLEEAIKANKQVDYFLYPTHEHNVYGKDRVHLNTKIANYFFDFLEKSNQE